MRIIQVVGSCVLLLSACTGGVDQGLAPDDEAGSARVSPADQFDLSPPLSDLGPTGNETGVIKSEVVASGTSFEGIGEGFTGPTGPFTFPPCPGCGAAPADAFIAVGPQHVVQVVHPIQESTATTGFGAFAIFNKAGVPLFGPVQITTLFSGFGGACATPEPLSFVYPMVIYDQLADRWVVSYTASTDAFNGPYAYCVAVSRTSDPTGSYARYSFNYPSSLWLQRPRLAVWPDAYYLSFNLSSITVVEGPEFCALDRARMLAGQAASKQCIHLRDPNTPGFFYSQPARLTGSTPPPVGAPGLFLHWGKVTFLAANWTLNLFKLRVDWNNPANTKLTGPTSLTPPVTDPGVCVGGDYCIPQVGANAPVLDAWGHRLMYGVAYRNFGDHESLVANMTVSLNPAYGSATGIRWYELRNPNTSPVLFQTGLYGPDGAASNATFRWLGSMAIDRLGNIGLGFFASSISTHPGLRFTGRVPNDAPGVMSQGEAHLIEGTGSLTDPVRSAGDFGSDSSLVVDPVDDCTFWYAGQYFAVDGLNNWHTRIGSFKLPGCAPALIAVSTLSINPSLLEGGTSTNGTVVLTGPAPTGGATVTLSSSNPAASVPANVTVPAGQLNATFTVTTSVVANPTAVTLSGTYPAGSSKSAVLNLTASPTPSSLMLSPVTVVSGTGAVGTVGLSGPAPAGGALVSLSSSHSVASVPASLTIPAGATVATFSVTTGSASASTSATLSVSYHGVTVSAVLTVTPSVVAPALSALTLGSASVTGGSSVSGTVKLTAAAPSGGAVVTLSSSSAAVATLPASVTVAAGATSAGFTVATSPVAAPVSVTLSGSWAGVTKSAALTVNPATSACAAGWSKVTLTVTGLTGTVTSKPSGLNVSSGNTGTGCFTNNNKVELQASRSARWSGVTCEGGSVQTRCRFNLGAVPASVTATLQ